MTTAVATGPTIRRGESSGDIWTPQEFIDAVEKRFGKLVWDLAASALSHKADRWFSERTNSLIQDWHHIKVLPDQNLLWLNPPYSNIAPWAKKCAEESQKGARILLLVPMGGQNWFWDYVEPFADVYSVGRMVFDNCFDKQGNPVTTPYPKDLILAYYDGLEGRQRMQRWRWKKEA